LRLSLVLFLFGVKPMITLMCILMFEIMRWFIKLMLWLMILPFKIIWWMLFGWWTPHCARKYSARDYDDGFIDGLIIGSLWD